ncbi:MAG: hypothetical protein P8Y23_00935 [Candidatus Lokiarchaeota archaeon]|jgi:hypothetical protein
MFNTKQIISVAEKRLEDIVKRVNEILELNKNKNVELVSITCPLRSYIAFIQFETDLPIGKNDPSQYIRLNQT